MRCLGVLCLSHMSLAFSMNLLSRRGTSAAYVARAAGMALHQKRPDTCGRRHAHSTEDLTRAQQTSRLGTMGLIGGAAMFASGSRSAKAEDEGFQASSSGLKFKILKEGTGGIPAPGQSVNVHYTGWLDSFNSEKKFDSSYDRRRPLAFRAGVGQVIQGWDESILQMKVGEKRNVVIPASLGYGSRGAANIIPPNATLYFTMELVSIA